MAFMIAKKHRSRPELANDKPQQEHSEPSAQGSKRIRLCCDISKERHRQLRIYAASSDMSIVDVIEDLITRYCHDPR